MTAATPLRIALFPGWAISATAMEPFARALENALPGADIRIHDLHTERGEDLITDRQASAVAPGTWLLGWSQGGQAAARLAARRGADCPGLVTLGSNPRFTVSEDWPHAMPCDTFDAFCAGFARNPEITFSRFFALCTKGGPGGRTLARALGEERPDLADCLARLGLLGSRDVRTDLASFAGPQLHLFATGDALVPVSVAGDMAALLPGAVIEQIEGGSHAFALDAPDAIARRVADFIREHRTL